MSSILDLPSVRARLPRISVEEYHRQGEFQANGRRTELIRGVVIEKMSKSPLHGTIASTLQDLLSPQIPAGFIIRREEPLTFADSEPEPDLCIVRGVRLDFLHANPSTAAIVVEVSVTSISEDRERAFLYAEAGIEEYWIVLPATKSVEVYRRPEDGRHLEMRAYRADEPLIAGPIPGLKLSLPALFAGL
jgi:Uma2 family endonuclease